MNAAQARDHFSSAYDGELEGEQLAAFERALQEDGQLAKDYAAFRATLDMAREGLEGFDGLDELQGPTPDLLSGVQSKLRKRSRGRYFGDRYAERRGRRRLMGPVGLSLVLMVLLGCAWLAVHYMNMMQVLLEGV